MTKFIPSGFDEAAVIAGLRKAMGFAEPTRDEEKVWFHYSSRTPGVGTDDRGVPFDPAADPVVPAEPLTTYCAVEFRDSGGQAVTFGQMDPAEIVITLIDEDYQEIKGFSYVVAAGDRYVYDFTEPVVALGPIDVWTIHAKADNER